jgi:hypothetical protein
MPSGRFVGVSWIGHCSSRRATIGLLIRTRMDTKNPAESKATRQATIAGLIMGCSFSQLPGFNEWLYMALCGAGISGGSLCLKSRLICSMQGDAHPFSPQNVTSQQISGSPPLHSRRTIAEAKPSSTVIFQSSASCARLFPLTHNGGFPYIPAI